MTGTEEVVDALDLLENLISAMRSKHASNQTAVLVAEVIAADARFNIRFGALKENATKSDDEMLQLLEASGRLLYDCKTSAEVFRETGNRGRLHAELILLREAFDNLAPSPRLQF